MGLYFMFTKIHLIFPWVIVHKMDSKFIIGWNIGVYLCLMSKYVFSGHSGFLHQ